MGIPASGKPVDVRTIDIWRAEDGKSVEHWDEFNLMQLFQQMHCRHSAPAPRGQRA